MGLYSFSLLKQQILTEHVYKLHRIQWEHVMYVLANLRRITGKLKKPTLGKNQTLNVERRSMCIIDKKE